MRVDEPGPHLLCDRILCAVVRVSESNEGYDLYLFHVNTYSAGLGSISSMSSSVETSATRQMSENWSPVRYSVEIVVGKQFV